MRLPFRVPLVVLDQCSRGRKTLVAYDQWHPIPLTKNLSPSQEVIPSLFLS